MTSVGTQWLVNGTNLEKISLMNLNSHFNPVSKLAELWFTLPLEHNDTTIQCIMYFVTENVSSNSITLLLQGQLLLKNNAVS